MSGARDGGMKGVSAGDRRACNANRAMCKVAWKARKIQEKPWLERGTDEWLGSAVRRNLQAPSGRTKQVTVTAAACWRGKPSTRGVETSAPRLRSMGDDLDVRKTCQTMRAHWPAGLLPAPVPPNQHHHVAGMTASIIHTIESINQSFNRRGATTRAWNDAGKGKWRRWR